MDSSVLPPELVANLTLGHLAARCLHLIAEHGVADALGEQSATAEELAKRSGTNADALGRMLRLLAAHGVFRLEGGAYVHTPASRLLRSDHPQSMRAYSRMIGSPAIYGGVTQLDHPLRTGKPAIDSATLFARFAEHPEESAVFNEAMVGKSASVIPAVVDAYDFGQFEVVADVGGGRGHFLQAILERTPRTNCILFDLPHVIEEATDLASPRLRLAAGDFFIDPLPIADAYALMEVIHDWADTEAAKILAAIRRAAPRHARVLIVETTVSEDPGPQFGKTLDIVMLAVTGGRERTPSEYAELLAGAGFRLERIVPTESAYSVIEGVAV